MKKIIWVAVALAFLISGCASYNPLGIIYTNGKVGMDAKNVPATKTGKSCMTSRFGLVATGDASIAAAMNNGGIKEFATIDYEVNNVLGVYGEYCIVVKGQ